VLLNAQPTELEQNLLVNKAMLVTRPGEAPALKWIVDTKVQGPELAAFQAETLRGGGTLIEHESARGAPHGFTELCVAAADVPAEVIALLPRRLQAAVAAAA
jgi:hypothetical protein